MVKHGKSQYHLFVYIYILVYIYIYIFMGYIWINYNDLTDLPNPGIMVNQGYHLLLWP